MSSKKKTIATKAGGKPAMVPKLRFPEFREADEWKDIPIASIVKVRDERRVPTSEIPLFSLTIESGITEKTDRYNRDFLVRDAGNKKYKLVEPNDIVYNPSNLRWGAINYSQLSHSVLVSPIYEVLRLGDDSGYFLEFIACAVMRDEQIRRFIAKGQGTLVERIAVKIEDFLSTNLPVPPILAEQQKIAECLSSVDELIAAQGRKVDALKTHKKGLLQQLFPRDGETQPRLRLPEFQNAGEWEESQLAKLTTRISDGIHTTPNYEENGEYAFINGNNLVNGKILIDEKTKRVNVDEFNKHRKPLDNTSILMSINGTIGNLAFYRNEDVILGKSACFINVDIGLTDRTFIYNLLQTHKVKNFFTAELTGSTIKNLSLGAIKGVLVSVPTLPEQQRIASCLSSLDALIAAEDQKLEALKTHKRGLMQQLFPSPDEVEV